jgi:hypothetical protein
MLPVGVRIGSYQGVWRYLKTPGERLPTISRLDLQQEIAILSLRWLRKQE